LPDRFGGLISRDVADCRDHASVRHRPYVTAPVESIRRCMSADRTATSAGRLWPGSPTRANSRRVL